MEVEGGKFQHDLILTNFICKNPISKCHILRFWVDMDLGGRHYLSQYKIQTSAQKIEGQNKTLLNYKEKKTLLRW